MIEHDKLKAYVVRVIRIDPSVAGGRFSLFYAVLTDTAENGLAIVQDSIPPDDDAEVTEGTLSSATVKGDRPSPRVCAFAVIPPAAPIRTLRGLRTPLRQSAAIRQCSPQILSAARE
ncbi:MAG: hypothetical protein JOY94_08540 [Methylobacteriaceae bacterium]|nr:hypothetical protein [Methylobacteriaceae bacterium]